MTELSSDDQLILFHLSRIVPAAGLAPSAPDISVANRKGREWARPRLVAMEKNGLVKKSGKTYSNADTWEIEDAGRAALQKVTD